MIDLVQELPTLRLLHILPVPMFAPSSLSQVLESRTFVTKYKRFDDKLRSIFKHETHNVRVRAYVYVCVCFVAVCVCACVCCVTVLLCDCVVCMLCVRWCKNLATCVLCGRLLLTFAQTCDIARTEKSSSTSVADFCWNCTSRSNHISPYVSTRE